MSKYLKSTFWVIYTFDSIETILQTSSFPVPIMKTITTTTQYVFDIPPSQFWHVFVYAWQGSILWGIPYLFVRRGLNPDYGAHFMSKFGGDALYGTLALVVAVYLQAAVKQWLLLLMEFVLWSPSKTASLPGDEL